MNVPDCLEKRNSFAVSSIFLLFSRRSLQEGWILSQLSHIRDHHHHPTQPPGLLKLSSKEGGFKTKQNWSTMSLTCLLGIFILSEPKHARIFNLQSSLCVTVITLHFQQFSSINAEQIQSFHYCYISSYWCYILCVRDIRIENTHWQYIKKITGIYLSSHKTCPQLQLYQIVVAYSLKYGEIDSL